eukprot:scaffold21455_cov116-Cylindrotheca_fusiformis.AAC.17
MLFPSENDATSRDHLHGRKVLVPYTKKAFVLGELRPQKDANQQEQVQIATGKNERQTVSLHDAKEWLLQKTNPPKKTEQHVPKKSSGTPAEAAKQPTPAPLVNMVDIQEEYNPDGTRVTGNVVNVSSEFQSLIESMGGTPMNLNADDYSYPEEEKGESFEDNDIAKKPLSDKEYTLLSQRLDELARLEELENERQQNNGSKLQNRVKTTKKTTNKGDGGWNKGFLNAPKKKPAKKKAPATTKPLHSEAITSSTPAASASVQESTSSTNTSNRGGVAFDMSQNKVQEIPSIPGTQPLPPRNTSQPAANTSGSNNSRMLDSNVFSGIIQERPAAAASSSSSSTRPSGIVERPMIQERRTQTARAPKAEPKKKKLSRFAQERMQ